MSNIPTFLKNKINRLIKSQGQEFTFQLSTVDEYNQPTLSENTLTFSGVYHEKNSFIPLATTEAANIQRKKSPMILALMEDITGLTQDSEITLNEVKYKVTGILDIQNYGVVADISLEMEV